MNRFFVVTLACIFMLGLTMLGSGCLDAFDEVSADPLALIVPLDESGSALAPAATDPSASGLFPDLYSWPGVHDCETVQAMQASRPVTFSDELAYQVVALRPD